MEAMMAEFNGKLHDLKTSMLLRVDESNEEMDTILLDMHNTLDELEKHVSYMSSFLSEEKVSIDLAQDIKYRLKAQHRYLEHLQSNLPKHLPGTADAAIRQALPNKHVKTKRLQKSATKTMKKTRDNDDSDRLPKVSYVTISEFDNVPKYIVKRLTREKINEAIDDINKVFGEKYRILRMNPSSMSQNMKARYWEYKESYIDEIKERPYITEKDLKSSNVRIKFKPDITGKTVLALLRHIGRIKEIRGGGYTRYVLTG
ncbi:3714_t:CDS:2 [Paraglomus brasilianum]|uniref:3714_t:CDS:1 n=1 Tax=Paraglomus brasilianum TaxID=144538 RepID=A0A9N8VY46_9GLOM|nr:3714_t:CDS:2 [Paraglomus brasilianum]